MMGLGELQEKRRKSKGNTDITLNNIQVIADEVCELRMLLMILNKYLNYQWCEKSRK